MDNSNKKLLNGTIVYFIGNALVQLMSLVMLRFVTGNISTDEYGYYNLIVTISNLITPVITLQISDAVFKFFIKAESDDERKKYYTIGILLTILSIFLTGIGIFILNLTMFPINHSVLVALYMITSNLFVLYQKIVRSVGKNTVFVYGNLLRTALYIGLQFLFIYGFNLGVETLFLSNTISVVVCILTIEIFVRSFKYFSLKCFDKTVLKEMLKFSIPLVPNAAFWWLTSSVIVTGKLGLDVNGIYSVSNKFSTVLTLVTSVFTMAWQESAIQEYGTEKFKRFFTQTFNMYFTLVISAVAVLVPFINVVFPYMIDDSYYASIDYAPWLLLASGLSAIGGFVSQIFVAQSKTQRSMTTTAVGVVANILIVFALVDAIGLWAAVLGTLIANLIILLTRIFMVRKDLDKGISVLKMLSVIVMISISAFCYMKLERIYNIVWFVIAAAAAVILNWGLIKDLLSVVLEKFFKRRSAK